MIYLASDHGGYHAKAIVKKMLERESIEHKDLGPHTLQTDDDYPDYILPLALRVAKEDAKGIISCRNGQGAAIIANKVPGIRAAVCSNEACAKSSRNDDNANILSLPADYLTEAEIETIVKDWLETPFSHDARHLRRIHKIRDFEQSSPERSDALQERGR